MWNRFMAVNSGQSAATVIGRNLFDCFPDLPRNVIENKIKSVLVLKNFAFSNWEQRPHLFKFRHNRPVTGGVEYMYQNCTFIPLTNAHGEVDYICATLLDVTDTAIYQIRLNEAMASLAEANRRDGLTGIYNRHFLEESFAKEFNRVRRYGGTMSLIMLDVDNFKTINDTFGHLAGDEVLRSMANMLNTALRQVDTLGRYGGEEFGVLLPATDLNGAHVVAEGVRKKIEETVFPYGDTAIKVTISAGIAQYHGEMARHETLIQEADNALYQAKTAGRNCVRCAPLPHAAYNDRRDAGNISPP